MFTQWALKAAFTRMQTLKPAKRLSKDIHSLTHTFCSSFTEDSTSANIASSRPFYVASSNILLVSLFVFGKFFTSIVLFYTQTIGSSGDQYIEIESKNTRKLMKY